MNVSLKQYWELLAQHIRPQRGRFILLLVLLLSSIGLQVINPQIMREFIDSALAGATDRRLMLTAAAFIGIALIQQVLAVSVTYLGENVAWMATNALRAELAWHCLNLDMSFHNSHTPGEMIERIDGDVTQLANFFSQFIGGILGNFLLMVGVLVALFLEDWRVGLAFTAFAALSMLALYLIRNLAIKYQKSRRQADAELFGFIEEQLNGTEDIRSSGAVEFSLRELFRLQSATYRFHRQAGWKEWMMHNVTALTLVLGNLMAVGSGYLLYRAGSITVGTVYLMIYYVNLLETPIWALTHQMEDFQVMGACIERLTELRKLRSVVLETGDTRANPLPEGPLALAFENVSFAYQATEPVLSDLSFQLQPGRVLGLLGRTGSGKTTLTRLVFRLYDPSSGRITLDGSQAPARDLRDLRLEALRQRIAIVTQDVQLFRASVRDNLTFFDSSISDEQIFTALETLELGEWYRSLPKGLDTILETGGHSLSAGEAQLLAFTRVFLRSPGLIILDEASSRLDPATEARIERAIDRLLAGRTAIVIAHRLHTVHRADQILILEDGRLCEHGSRAHLAVDPKSRFYQLLQTGMEEVLA
jgi:ATP-binding cassette, subfamily B, bacterial